MIALHNRRIVEPDSLNGAMEFDHVIYSHGDGTVSGVRGVYAPEWRDGFTESPTAPWELMAGWTGQYGYNGPRMHPSESIGGSMARHILSTPGIYVAVVVYEHRGDNDECDGPGSVDGCTCEPSEWSVCVDNTTPVDIPSNGTFDLEPDTHMDALELGIDTTGGPWVSVYVNDDGRVWLDMTEGTEWHAEYWTQTQPLDPGPFDTDGQLTADGLRFTLDRLRSIYPNVEWTDVTESGQDTPAVEFSVELDGVVTVANVAERAYSVWARVVNVTDPGTFGCQYLFDGWNEWQRHAPAH